MSLIAVRNLSRSLQAQLLRPCAARGFATPGTENRLERDPRTEASKERANATDEATKDSIRHAAEGNATEAIKDVGEMAKQAAKGAKESAKLMYDSTKEKLTGKPSSAREDLKKGSS